MISAEIFNETLLQFFAPIRPYFDDPTVTDIMINGPEQIFIERRGKLELTPARFESREALLAALRNAAQFVGKQLDELRPILEGRLPDGSRIEAIIPPAAPDGPCVSIRRFFKETLTMDRLLQFGSMTEDAADALRALVVAKCNVIIAGGTGSGKTSMLNALSAYIPEDERVVVIEDSQEVQMQRQHAVQLEARPADAKGKGAVPIRELFRATLRMRPDRIIIGEIRGGEALDIIQAMTSGHGGCMGTLHATYPRDTLTRLETMCLMSEIDIPLSAMRAQIASAMQILVQVARLQDGSRKVTHIAEVVGFDHATGTYGVLEIFHRIYHGLDARGAVVSELVPTGALPTLLPQLHERGVDLPRACYYASEKLAAEAHRS